MNSLICGTEKQKNNNKKNPTELIERDQICGYQKWGGWRKETGGRLLKGTNLQL